VQNGHLSAGILINFGDNGNAVGGIVARQQALCSERSVPPNNVSDWKFKMPLKLTSLKLAMAAAAASLLLSGCMETANFEATNTSAFKQRDKELLAKVRYENVQPPENFRRAIVEYQRKEAPGSIVVDSDNHYLYFVLNDGKAIRYGITVGEEAMAWSGIAKIGSMAEWPPWHPTKSEIERLGVPTFVPPGPDNPMGSRALYLYSGGKDTLFRIHGTNQPEYIGQSISSGCIRMTNEDVIDLYNRAKMGTIVVVLAPHHGDAPFGSSQMALGGNNSLGSMQ
jgi:lipoprotein-anchoring transpeptidase ErfK/SrfK